MAESDLTRDEILGTNFEYTQAGSLAPEDTVSGPWAGGDEITADKLNQFDKGISDAYVGIIAVADNLSTMSTQVNQIQYVVNSEENNGGLAAQVGRLDSEITLLKDDDTKSGSIAKSIKDAVDPVKVRLDAIDGTTPTTLKSRVDDIESKYASKNDLTTQMNTAFNENAFINEIKNAHRTGNELSSPANNYEDSLDSRFDDIEAVLRSKNNNSKGANLNARFIALEAAIETITGSDVDSGSLTALAARIAVLEDALKSALDSDEDNVWDTLEDYLQGLEEDVANLKAEIGQFDNSRIDALETVISHTKDASDETDKGGLTQRIDALEASIGDNEGNSLSGRVAALEGINADNRLNDLEDIATEVAAARGESANLDARLDTLAVAETVNSALETKAAAADLTTLTGRVATLEGKDTVVMTVAAFEALDVASDTVNKNADYIVGPYTEEDNIYKYYRIINNQKELISGAASGSGNNSAEIVNVLPQAADASEEMDYYLFNSTLGAYEHYRYIRGQFYKIGGDRYSNTQINNLIDTAVAGLGADDKRYYATYGKITETVNGEEVTKENMFSLYEVDKTDTEHSNPVLVSRFEITGGGGGQSAASNLTVTPITKSPVIALSEDKLEITVEYSSTDEDTGSSYSGTYAWRIGGATVETGSIYNGLKTFDLTNYCPVGTQRSATLSVTDETGTLVTRTWTIQRVNISMTSNFNESYAYTANETVNFVYSTTGSISKTVHVILAGTALPTVTSDSAGTNIPYQLPAKPHGTYLLEAYLTANAGGKELETPIPHIYKDVMYVDENSTTPLLGCAYRYGQIDVTQYGVLNIPYTVYDPVNKYPTITLKRNDEVISTFTTDKMDNIWAYRATTVGTETLSIECGSAKVTISLNVTELPEEITPITDNLAFDFNPAGRSNIEINTNVAEGEPVVAWTSGTTSITLSDGFDLNNGGYQIDADGNTYFCVKAGNRATVNFNLFGLDSANTGANFKCIFKVSQVRNVNAQILSCISENNGTPIGIDMRAHEAKIYTSADSLMQPYSEDDRIEFEYNISPLTGDSIIMTYEDGVGARPLLYNSDHILTQSEPVPITIGSDDCDVAIYRLKVYRAALTDANILKNFYADAVTPEEMLDRYNRNQIYDAEGKLTPESVVAACPDLKVICIEAPYFTNDKADYVKNTTVTCRQGNGRSHDNWTFTNGFHVGQGTSSNRYGAAGRNIDIIFGFDGTHTVVSKIPENTVQGYVSKVEFADGTILTGADAKINLSDESVENSWFNIKVNIASSENANNALLQKRYNRYLPYKTPGQRRDSRVKNSMEFQNCVIFIKENSSDMADHREFLDNEWHFYGIGNIGDSKKTDNTRVNDPTDLNEFVVEISDNNLPNSMFQTGVYWTDETHTATTYENLGMEYMKYPVTAAEWNNENNLARKSLSVDGYVSGTEIDKDTGEEKDVITNWDSSFEFRYDMGTKDGETMDKAEIKAQQRLNKEKWIEMYTWFVTCPDDRFAAELGNWFIVESPLYWYVFTERYTMIDNRAKNSFWHFGKTYITEAEAEEMGADAENYTINNAAAAINNGYRFDLWDYDNDTALGIDNSGILNITYGKEDVDFIEGSSALLYNAGRSVFWRRIRGLMGTQLANMYSSTVSVQAWNAQNLIDEFDAWQNQFPEELWRLDIERKYIRPYRDGSYNSTTQEYVKNVTFLRDMANGRKRYQRRQFERDMEIYMATKYLQAAVLEDTIDLRLGVPSAASAAVVPANYTLKIVPYSDMYLRVMYGNVAPTSQRVKAGQEYDITPPATIDDPSTLQIVIYGASRIQELSDLSACYIRDNNFSKARKLRKLVLGNKTVGYENAVIASVGLGNNPLLEELNLRNCTGLTSNLDLSSCVNLQKLYAENTGLRGVTFATNGKLIEAILPNTLTSLGLRNLYDLTNLTLAGNDYISSFVCENTNGIDSKSIVEDIVDTLNTTSLLGINWELNSTTILQELLKKRNNGKDIEITGKIKINGALGSQEIKNYRTAWPGVEWDTSNANTFNQSHIIYKYADIIDDETGDIVTKGAQIYETYINSGTAFPDPWNSDPEYQLIEAAPTKEPNIRNKYIFGTLLSGGTYQRNSGWTIETHTSSIAAENAAASRDDYPVNEEELTVIATFSTEPQLYKIRWFLEPEDANAVAETTDEQAQPYGGGANIVAPTIREMRTAGYETVRGFSANTVAKTCSYRIFDGWTVSPTNIAPTEIGGTYDIYGHWLQRSNINYMNEMINDDFPVEEKLFLASRLADIRGSEAFDLMDRFALQMGYNGPDATWSLSSMRTFDANTAAVYRTGIKPFANPEKGFTLMLDYKLGTRSSESAIEAILASCLATINGTTVGFKLYYDPREEGTLRVPRVGFGSTDSTTSSSNNICVVNNNTEYRHIVVLRHEAGSKNLYVYSGSDASGFKVDMNAAVNTLYWQAGDLTSDAELVLGGLINPDNTHINAYGTIYAASYWDEDLGRSECQRLANWCHETMTFAVADYSENTTAHSTNIDNIALTALNASDAGMFTEPMESSFTPNVTTISWENSTLRQFYNTRIFDSLPVVLQSAMALKTVHYREALYQSANMTTGFNITTQDKTSQDFIFAPTFRELRETSETASNYGSEANGPFPWYKASTFTVLNGASSTFETITGNAQYANIRFPHVPLIFNQKIVANFTATTENAYSVLAGQNKALRRGDILIVVNSDSASYPFMYVDSTDVNTGITLATDASTNYPALKLPTGNTGGWVAATGWWTRSILSGSQQTRFKFIQVSSNGNVNSTNRGTSATSSIVYSLAI